MHIKWDFCRDESIVLPFYDISRPKKSHSNYSVDKPMKLKFDLNFLRLQLYVANNDTVNVNIRGLGLAERLHSLN